MWGQRKDKKKKEKLISKAHKRWEAFTPHLQCLQRYSRPQMFSHFDAFIDELEVYRVWLFDTKKKPIEKHFKMYSVK